MSRTSQGVGIEAVAEAAGVSVTTVSNVLNGRTSRMRSETLMRVRQEIERLGYMPSASARQLKTGRSRTIGLVVPTVANPFWGAVAHETEKAAALAGYSLMICNAERDPEAERRYAEMLLSYGVRGVIFGSSQVSFQHLAPLIDRGLVVGAFDRKAEGADAVVRCSISVDNELGGRLASRHLIGIGHRRIATLSGPIRTASRLDRIAGFRAAMEDAGLDVDPDLIWQGNTVRGFGDSESVQIGADGMRELLARREAPTAVFAINDLYALGAYLGATSLGLRVPQDISIVGFDDIVFAEIANPPLTTIRQPTAAMARSIVASLLAEIEPASGTAEAHRQAAPELVLRNSTAPPPR